MKQNRHSIILISLFFLLTVVFLGTNCTDNEKKSDARQEIIKADKDFSEMSEKEGMVKAFLEYADDNAVLLRPKSMPLKGIEQLKKHYARVADSLFILTWEPLSGETGASGDMGYTYGTYRLTMKNNPDKFEEGTYATVWKRNAQGAWKWVLDTGNEGLIDTGM